MTDALKTFYDSERLQTVDWRSAFQHTHSLPYTRLMTHLQKEQPPAVIRIYSSKPAAKGLWIRNPIGSYTRVRGIYSWANDFIRSPNFTEANGHLFTAEQLIDKLSAVFSVKNYRACVVTGTAEANYSMFWK